MALLRKYFGGLSANTFFLALASMFADISTEMLYPIMPLFLTETVGVGANIVGLIEGIAQTVQNVVQGLSGWLSDKLQRRKSVALIGFVVAALAKPFMGMATHWSGFLAARSLDRLGSGTRSAPRDALVAASADEANRGKAFGLEGFGDNLGAFLGPLLALALLGIFALNIRSIFLLALVPGLLATFMVLLVRDQPVQASAKAKLDLSFRAFPRRYWKYLFVTALFGVGNSSNSFLILRTSGLGVSLTTTIFIYALFNLVAALASYPAGYLSDRLGRRDILLVCFGIYIGVYLGFGTITDPVLVAVLFVLYGVFQGIFRSVGKALASDCVPAELRASGVGWYTATVGLSGLIASIVAGELWVAVSPGAAFLCGAGFALLGSIALVVLVSRHGDAGV